MTPATPTPLHPAGPRGLPFLGMLPAIRRDPLGVFSRMRAQYGDVVHFNVAGRHGFLVSDPAHIGHVLQGNYQSYHKSPLYEKLRPLLGNGLLLSEEGFWLRQRRLMQPAFHRQRVAHLGAVMTDTTLEMLARWREPAEANAVLDVAGEMMQLTQTIILKTMFSTDLDDVEVLERVWPLVNEHIGVGIWSLGWTERLPTRRNREYRRALRHLDGLVRRIIEARRRSTTDAAADLLSMLLAARDEETGERMDDRELRDEVMTVFLAGHETTSLALAWTWYLLSIHPAAEARVAEEVREQLAGRPPTFDDLPRLPYVRMVLEEAMRLYPPAWGISRVALAEDRLGPYRIPAESVVFIIPYVVHRHPVFWDEPDVFRPERFAPDEIARRPKGAYLPFGAGPRQCIGNQFAMVEAQLIVATIAQRYRLALVPGHPIASHPLITLRPRYGVRMTVHPQGR